MIYKLSKSDYCHGRICQKRLWLSIHKSESAKQLSEFDKWNIERGYEVEGLAQELFPNSLKIHQDRQNIDKYLDETQQNLNKSTKTIFQGAFLAHNVLVICDILDKQDDGSYHLFEVKSFSDPKSKIQEKDQTNFYINDLLIQAYVLMSCGLKISRVCIMFLNKQYERNDQLEPKLLFNYHDLDLSTIDISAIEKIIQNLISVKQSSTEPIRDMGAHCNKPFECSFTDYCNNLLPNDSLRKTNIFHWKTRDNLLKSGQDRLSNLDLGNSKVIDKMAAIKAELEDKVQLDKSQLAEFINSIKYPIYFLDFEAARFPIPRYKGQHPYELLPFQYSLHILESADASPIHKEFLWEYDADPALACAKGLCKDIDVNGSILMYSNYEEQVLNYLIKKAPECQNVLSEFISRLIDLEYPFKSQICCIPKSMGYSSIKVIQPLLNPQFGYNGLAVQSGDMAMVKYWQLINANSDNEKKNIATDLKAYCRQDTMAMLMVFKSLLALQRS